MNDALSLLRRLAACYSGVVFDALRARGVTNTVLPKEIAPLDPAMILAGPIFTVLGSPKPNIDPHQSLLAWTEFLARAPRGYVVICEGNDTTRALMGELSAETLQFRGVKGYVTDGASRDCGFIKRIGFPVFCRDKTPRDVVGAWAPDAFNEPIVIGGCRIVAGDYAIGDIDGVVIIPGQIAGSVIEDVEKLMRTENLVRKAILEGADPKEAYLRYGKF
jgi:4-hydroxy-4-methyl-2-oxoglutarate aldolase